MTISGWGTTSQSGSQSPVLKAAFVTGLTNPACAAAGYGKNITKNMLCASTKAFDTDACQGDSGGSNPVCSTMDTSLLAFTSNLVRNYLMGLCIEPHFAAALQLSCWNVLQRSQSGATLL